MIVTVTVVGFGDIYPLTAPGQAIVIGSLMVILSRVPTEYAAYARAKNLRSPYSNSKFVGGGENTDHITL